MILITTLNTFQLCYFYKHLKKSLYHLKPIFLRQHKITSNTKQLLTNTHLMRRQDKRPTSNYV